MATAHHLLQAVGMKFLSNNNNNNNEKKEAYFTRTGKIRAIISVYSIHTALVLVRNIITNK